MRVLKFAILGIPLALFVAAGSNPAHTAPADRDVRVVNTAAEPVPVSGAVSVTGTVQAQQSGVWTVGVSGPLTIASSEANPLVTRIVQPARQAFTKRFFFSFSEGNATASQTFSIPLGKRLVVEHFSADVQMTPGNQVWRLAIAGRADDEQTTHLFALAPHGTSNFGRTVFTVSQPVRMYLDSTPLSSPVVVADRSSTTGPGDTVLAALTGYLVDCPTSPCGVQ